jgi:hypothetical protein
MGLNLADIVKATGLTEEEILQPNQDGCSASTSQVG